jgi:hypothetical protein
MLSSRPVQAEKIRIEAARFARRQVHPAYPSNGDEDRYPNRIGNYSKGLPHDRLGEVDIRAYNALRNAFLTGSPCDFENLPLAPAANCPNGRRRKLTNPQAGLCFDLEGPDAQAVTMPPAPRFDSAEEASEMAELYWMALLRDVPFEDYVHDNTVADAVEDLNNFSAFRGPKERGRITPATLFRGFTAGDLVGPYVSQFLLKDFNYGTLRVSHKQQTAKPKVDYVTDYQEWHRIQDGCDPGVTRANQLERDGRGEFVRRYIRSARDLATYVHFDQLDEAYLNACLILLDDDVKAPFDPGNPYTKSGNQIGFATFGVPHALSLVSEVSTCALKAVWWQKWGVHRRLRPEEFGGRIHNYKRGKTNYPINREILNSPVLNRIHDQHQTYLLPQAFPEGSPTHPAYGAGHAVVAGACVTILKAWFDESTKIEQLFEPQKIVGVEGSKLETYTEADKEAMTVGSELNKLAANIAIGRNMGGVHWRSDYSESVKLGEAVAIQTLQEQMEMYNEDYSFTLSKFDGAQIEISNL